MAFKIDTEQCAGCGVCEGTCANGAIIPESDKYAIDPKKCNDCGNCSQSCPVNCIIGANK